jgi:hypothetical protein
MTLPQVVEREMLSPDLLLAGNDNSSTPDARAVARPDVPESLEPVVFRQRGLVTRRQLAEHGMTPAMIRTRTASRWRLVLPGVVLLSRLELDVEQRLVAAQLMCGPAARMASTTAAVLHGLQNVRDDRLVRVHVPLRQASRDVAFVRVRRTSLDTDHVLQRGIVAFEPLARAVADAAREARDDRAAGAIVLEAVQRRLVRIPELRHELERGPRAGSARLRRALAAAEIGAWSVAELDLLELLATSAVLPRACANPQLWSPDGARLPTPDVWFDDVGLAVQVHSRSHHEAPADWDRTVRTDSVLAEYGITRLAVTPREIRTDGPGVLGRVERAYRARVGLPRPRVVMRPRTDTT